MIVYCVIVSSNNNNSSILYTVPVANVDMSTQPNNTMFDSVSDISHSTRYSSTSAENDTTFDSDSFSLNHELGLYLPSQHQTEIIKAQATQDIKHHFPEPLKERKAIIEDADPDIIIGTETWLDSTIGSAEILTYQLGYDIQRRDRPNDAHGGVLIAAKKSLQLGEVEYSTSIEFISASTTAGRNDIGNWTCIHYLQYVQNRWGLRTPNMLLAGYPTLLTWKGRYVLTRLKTSRWLLHVVRE